MAAIRGVDTKPELLLRHLLHGRGFRYRLHDRKLPGRPDLIFPRYRAVLFINGCFWHGHMCYLFKWPRTRPEFWQEKIRKNISRDQRNIASLAAQGWRIGIVWECAIKGSKRLEKDEVSDLLAEWLTSDVKNLLIPGQNQETKETRA